MYDTLSPVRTERHLAWHYDVLEFPLDDILHAAHAAGAKHNDAFLSAITAGLRLYHERHDTQVDELRVTMPVSIRKADDPIGGNRITLMRFKVPVGIADAERADGGDALSLRMRCGPSGRCPTRTRSPAR